MGNYSTPMKRLKDNYKTKRTLKVKSSFSKFNKSTKKAKITFYKSKKENKMVYFINMTNWLTDKVDSLDKNMEIVFMPFINEKKTKEKEL